MGHRMENMMKMQEAYDILDSIDENHAAPGLLEAKAMLEDALNYDQQEQEWEWK